MEAKPMCWRCGGNDHYAGICPDAIRQAGPSDETDPLPDPYAAALMARETGLAQDPGLTAYQKRERVRDAGPALLEALKDLLGDGSYMIARPDGSRECGWCGRQYYESDGDVEFCESDDCPGYIARAAIAQAEAE